MEQNFIDLANKIENQEMYPLYPEVTTMFEAFDVICNFVNTRIEYLED